MSQPEQDAAPSIVLSSWTGPWDPDDPDANFKAEVASYSLADPITTLENLATNLAIPVGALARFVLAKWASAGAQALLDVGPSTVDRMRDVVAAAEQDGTDTARLAAYQRLQLLLEWLGHGIDHPESTYPDGGAAP